ncbi:MAG: hypothetical protein QXI33_01270 [Candidatus Pacearchaeota archaeon]
MKDYLTNLRIKKEKLVETLREVKYKGLEGIPIEGFVNHKDHPIYVGFTMDLASMIEKSSMNSFSVEDYSKSFIDTIRLYFQKIDENDKYGNGNKLTYGKLQKVHNYFDILSETIFTRIFGEDYGKNLARKAIKAFDNYEDFLSIYEDKKRVAS